MRLVFLWLTCAHPAAHLGRGIRLEFVKSAAARASALAGFFGSCKDACLTLFAACGPFCLARNVCRRCFEGKCAAFKFEWWSGKHKKDKKDKKHGKKDKKHEEDSDSGKDEEDDEKDIHKKHGKKDKVCHMKAAVSSVGQSVSQSAKVFHDKEAQPTQCNLPEAPRGMQIVQCSFAVLP